MQEYISSLLLVSMLAAVATLLFPEKNERLRRFFEFGVALLLLAVICRPLTALRDLRLPSGDLSFSEMEEITGGGEELLSELSQSVARGIEADLAGEYRFDPACVTAELTLVIEGEEVCIDTLSLRLTGAALLTDTYTLREFARTRYQVKGEVNVYGG